MLTVDTLAQEIRRVDGNHSLGAGALAEALMPFLAALAAQTQQGVEEGPAPYTRVVGKPTIAVGTYTITELYAGRAVESDFVIMVPAEDLTILMDGAEQQLARPLKITDSVILAACRAHTPQFDRLDAEIARYAKDQMREALTAAHKVMEISR